MRLPSHTTVVAYTAAFIALGGVSYAAIAIPADAIGERQLKAESVGSAELQKASVGAAELKREAVQARAIRDGTIGEQDLSSQLKQVIASVGGGGQAAPGPQGERGARGEPGDAGADGLGDTAAQALGKLKQVAGSGSGLDADRLDGADSTQLAPVLTSFVTLEAQGFPILEPIAVVPGYGTLRAACASDTLWDTQWSPEPSVSARAFVDSTDDGAKAFEPDSSGSVSSSGGEDSEVWQVTTANGGMRLTVGGSGLNGTPDRCRYSVVVVLDPA